LSPRIESVGCFLAFDAFVELLQLRAVRLPRRRLPEGVVEVAVGAARVPCLLQFVLNLGVDATAF